MKGNDSLMKGVNEAIAAALSDGSMDKFVAEANELSVGNVYEGLLDENGKGRRGLRSPEATTPSPEITAKSLSRRRRGPCVHSDRRKNHVYCRRLCQGSGLLKLFLQGVVCTVCLSFLTVLFGFLLALLITGMRMSDFRPFRALALTRDGHERGEGFLAKLSRFNPIRFIASVYVELFRATPMVVQIMLVYYGLFNGVKVLPGFMLFGFIRFERFFPGVVALALNSGAYLSEIIRSGIQSIDGGQTEASRSLGMSSCRPCASLSCRRPSATSCLPSPTNCHHHQRNPPSASPSACRTSCPPSTPSRARPTASPRRWSSRRPCIFCLTYPTSKVIAHFEKKMSAGSSRNAANVAHKRKVQAQEGTK